MSYTKIGDSLALQAGRQVPATFHPMAPQAAGTIGAPIPFVMGMDVLLAKKDMLPCVWPPATGNEWEAV